MSDKKTAHRATCTDTTLCLSVRQSICLSFCLSTCRYACPSRRANLVLRAALMALRKAPRLLRAPPARTGTPFFASDAAVILRVFQRGRVKVYLCTCPPIHLSICPSICLSFFLSISLSVFCDCISLSIYLSDLSLFMFSVNLSLCVSSLLFIYLSACYWFIFLQAYHHILDNDHEDSWCVYLFLYVSVSVDHSNCASVFLFVHLSVCVSVYSSIPSVRPPMKISLFVILSWFFRPSPSPVCPCLSTYLLTHAH